MSALEELISRLNKVLEDESARPVFAFSGVPIKTSVKYPDGRYKTKDIQESQEFFLSGVRGGKRNQLIMELTPVDSREYVQAEISTTNHMALFRCEIAGSGSLDMTGWIIANSGVTASTIGRVLGKIEKELGIVKAEAEAAAKKQQLDVYSGNPNFGLF